MGLLIDGQWHDEWYDTKSTGGRFVRTEAQFRIPLSDLPNERFQLGDKRYHLFVSYACPWAHRTLIARKLKGLDRFIDYTSVSPLMLKEGWEFDATHPDPLFGSRYLRDLYLRTDPKYTGRVTVPVLFDRDKGRISCNESEEILRLFDVAEEGSGPELYPKALRQEINELNAYVYPNINNGVYRAGFATTQEAYEEAVEPLFRALDVLEGRLEGKRYLVRDTLTEADIRLFTTLVRFDPVYVTHFKCNLRRIADCPNLYAHTRRIYQLPGVAETVRMDHIRNHYYRSHPTINPYGIVPVGMDLDLSLPVES
ncbi:MAG: glutathione S-transferase family protein [Sandaracinaceae bacterium]|nr:glutathione S-transferase family protein [Sandaracinaceae bacterium]